jgi:hypothetical protein
MCSVWFEQQATILSLWIIHRVLFIMEEIFQFAIRANPFNIIQFNMVFNINKVSYTQENCLLKFISENRP